MPIQFFLKKYYRIIIKFANKQKLSLDEALGFFYNSVIYQLISAGIPDIHCMSDEYLAEEISREYNSN